MGGYYGGAGAGGSISITAFNIMGSSLAQIVATGGASYNRSGEGGGG